MINTLEKAFQSLARDENINQEWLRSEAIKAGIDFDEDTKDEFNRELLINKTK